MTVTVTGRELTINYEAPGPKALAFMMSQAFIRGIRGPVGSGKSTAAVIDMLQTAMMQKVGPDGRKRYRGVIIRNTYGELLTTTLATFHQWIPKDFGQFLKTAPMVHRFTCGNLDAEFLFLALDRPEHVAKLLSLEVTQGWINEAREVPKAILDALTARVGRYPSMAHGGAVRAGVIMDTNSPDQGHWWAQMSDFKTPEMIDATRKLEEELRGMGALPPGQPLVEFFNQPAAELLNGQLNSEAENIHNLPAGYYLKAKINKNPDWIKVYILNQYHFVMDGQPVYDNYRDTMHVVAKGYNPQWPLHIGMDFGLTPAAVIGQVSPMGQKRILSEIVSTRMGIIAFAQELRGHLALKYGANPLIGTITGDPAGNAGMPDDSEKTVFTVLAAQGIKAQPAATNDFTIRQEAVNTPMRRLIDGEPEMVIHPECLELRKACGGGYHFRRIQTTGEARFDVKPHKNMSSHIAEALQYFSLGVGSGKEVILQGVGMKQQNARRQQSAYHEWDYYAH